MGVIYAFLAILGESFTTVIDKLNFKRNRIAAQQLMLLVFSTMTLSLLVFIFLVPQPVPDLSLASLSLIALIILVSFLGNVFDYLSLKADDLSLREPLSDFEPIMAGLIAYVLFPAEREATFLIAFLISVVIVYWGTHRRKLRKVQKKGMFFMLLAVCLFGLLPSIYKLALEYLSPAYITLFRVAAILALLSIFVSWKKIGKLTTRKLRYGLLSGVVCSLGAVAGLYAISSIGVVFTMLLMLLGPFIRYSAGFFILKEKVRTGELVSSSLLVIIVITSVAKVEL